MTTLIPTLAAMADVYRLPSTGGATSPRFEAYVALNRQGVPLHPYNPMTKRDVLSVVEALLAIDAETVAAAAIDRTLARIGGAVGAQWSLAVAAPGMWTDRVTSDIDHRLRRTAPTLLLWWDDLVPTVAGVAASAAAQAARASRARPPANAWEATEQEGQALLAAHAEDPSIDLTITDAERRAVADALDIVGDDMTFATMVAIAEGDDAAAAFGYQPLGIGPRAGARHAAAQLS